MENDKFSIIVTAYPWPFSGPQSSPAAVVLDPGFALASPGEILKTPLPALPLQNFWRNWSGMGPGTSIFKSQVKNL